MQFRVINETNMTIEMTQKDIEMACQLWAEKQILGTNAIGEVQLRRADGKEPNGLTARVEVTKTR